MNMISKFMNNYLSNEDITLFDVGAKGGIFPLPKLAPYTSVYAFEPNPFEFKKLTLLKKGYPHYKQIQYFQLALSEHTGTAILYIARKPSYSSLLKFDKSSFKKHQGLMQNYSKWVGDFEIEESVNVKTYTLNSFCSDHHIQHIDFLKLDTQGSELSVIKGGQRQLSNIGVIKCEVNFTPVYESQNLFSEIDLFLRGNGFEFIDCIFYPDTVYDIQVPKRRKQPYDKQRYSGGGDAIYVRQKFKSKTSSLKSALILAELGYLSEAYFYLTEESSVSKNEAEKIIGHLAKSQFKTRVRNFARGWTPPKVYAYLKKYFRALA